MNTYNDKTNVPGVSEFNLRLYLASSRFPQRQDIEDSERTLALLDRHKVGDPPTPITYLDNLDSEGAYFKLIKDPRSKLRLPFMVVTHGTILYGYSGLEEVKEFLERDVVGTKSEDPIGKVIKATS